MNVDDARDHHWRNDDSWADAYEPLPWTPEERQRREWVDEDLRAAEWRFAKTMPDNPHEYTLRKTWPDYDPDAQRSARFLDAVRFVRDHGYVEWWPPFNVPWRHPYLNWQYRDGEGRLWFVWTNGWTPEETELINRKPLDPPW